MTNKIDERTHPWGAPVLMAIGGEDSSIALAYCVRSVRKSNIHNCKYMGTLSSLNLSIMRRGCKVLNADE